MVKAVLAAAKEVCLTLSCTPPTPSQRAQVLLAVALAASSYSYSFLLLFTQPAPSQVRKSKALLEVIQYTLALGNYMNGTSNKGGAWGFKLEAPRLPPSYSFRQ